MSTKEKKKQEVIAETLTKEQLYDLVLEILEEEVEKRVKINESKRRINLLRKKKANSKEKRRRLKEHLKSKK